jgi:hypothetical protein
MTTIEDATLLWQEFGTGLRAELARRGALGESPGLLDLEAWSEPDEPMSPEIVLVCPELRLTLGLP